MTEVTTMRIYVASLSDYNAGTLHGAWLDVSDADTMREEIAAMLAESPAAKAGDVAEEWAIHDYEGFSPYRVSEHEDLETLAALAEGEEEHGAAFLAWAENDPSNLDDPSNFQDAYAGEWDSLTDYVEDYMEQSGAEFKAPEGQWFHPANYVDWDRMAHDLEMSGDVWTAEAEGGGVYVFHNR
jgi:antirestriction protein